MPALNIMIDIETLGKRTDAYLIQVAAIAFDIETGTLSHAFNGVIRNSGGVLDVDTVAWWMQQAHAPVLGAKLQDASQAGDEREVLEEFCRFFRLCGDVDRVWAHGGTGFDFPILQSAFQRCGLAVPWHYRAPRDTRSLFDVAPGGMPRPPKDPQREHDAQYDCEYQIAQVVEAWSKLREQAADAGLYAKSVVAGYVVFEDEQGGTHSSPEAAVPALPPCEDCGGEWRRTGCAPPGPETVHVCTADEALLQDAADAQALR